MGARRGEYILARRARTACLEQSRAHSTRAFQNLNCRALLHEFKVEQKRKKEEKARKELQKQEKAEKAAVSLEIGSSSEEEERPRPKPRPKAKGGKGKAKAVEDRPVKKAQAAVNGSRKLWATKRALSQTLTSLLALNSCRSQDSHYEIVHQDLQAPIGHRRRSFVVSETSPRGLGALSLPSPSSSRPVLIYSPQPPRPRPKPNLKKKAKSVARDSSCALARLVVLAETVGSANTLLAGRNRRI